MAQTAAQLVYQRHLPYVPVRQWVLSSPIPLRLLLAAQPKQVTPVLQVVHRMITRYLLKQAGAKADEADSGAVTLIQRFGSAANLNISRRPTAAADNAAWAKLVVGMTVPRATCDMNGWHRGRRRGRLR
jgi:hypothetical protein